MKTKMMKIGMTMALVAALAAGSVVTFADTAVTAGTNVVNRFGGNSLIDKLIKDGVVTQAQIDKYHEQMHTERQAELKTAIAKLVTDGKLTQAKADAFLKAHEVKQAEMTALRTKLDAMSEADRQAYLKNNDPRKNDPVQALVTNGTLTQADLQIIHEAVGMGGPHMGGKGMGGRGQGKGMGGMFGGGMRNNGAPCTPSSTGTGL